MVEHVAILDADRHEVKHASSALLDQVLHSDGSGGSIFKFLDYSSIINIPVPVGYEQILTNVSLAASQGPVALDTPYKVEFGAGIVTADATLNSAGRITFHVEGDYLVSVFLRFGRTAGAGTSTLLSRLLVNGSQVLSSNAVRVPDQNSITPFSAAIPVHALAGTYFELEIARDSSGINNGGLFRVVPAVLPWSAAASASVVVSKFIGVAV